MTEGEGYSITMRQFYEAYRPIFKQHKRLVGQEESYDAAKNKFLNA